MYLSHRSWHKLACFNIHHHQEDQEAGRAADETTLRTDCTTTARTDWSRWAQCTRQWRDSCMNWYGHPVLSLSLSLTLWLWLFKRWQEESHSLPLKPIYERSPLNDKWTWQPPELVSHVAAFPCQPSSSSSSTFISLPLSPSRLLSFFSLSLSIALICFWVERLALFFCFSSSLWFSHCFSSPHFLSCPWSLAPLLSGSALGASVRSREKETEKADWPVMAWPSDGEP